MKFHILILICSIIISVASAIDHHKPTTFKSTPFINSKDSKFGPLIEGTSVNKAGEVFATSFGNKSSQIAHITPEQTLYHASPRDTTYFNGIRFLPLSKQDEEAGIKNILLATNLIEEEITKIMEMDDGTTKQETFCKDDSFIKPNDLTLSKSTGRIYISGQNYSTTTKIGDGGLWLCQPDGKAMQLLKLERTNGVELSPDENFLYVSEGANRNSDFAISNKIWKFKVDHVTGFVSQKELFVDFEKLDGTQTWEIDGIRTDIEGNLYVTRYFGQKIVTFSPNKKVLFEIDLSFKNPTNLEFAGKNGKTLFIVGKCPDDETKGCVDKFENDIPGRAFTYLNAH
ncbi:274_t:CDS:1 [Funneliformis caledonium]|uniref:274_t:CDS:1 n=1 Tax=Funneliformis caledonium TaxID=1117310 RepID=A0A9N9C7F4_9GLOM|nr:274_t:CDS:1 [Funneliformis caledonium]